MSHNESQFLSLLIRFDSHGISPSGAHQQSLTWHAKNRRQSKLTIALNSQTTLKIKQSVAEGTTHRDTTRNETLITLSMLSSLFQCLVWWWKFGCFFLSKQLPYRPTSGRPRAFKKKFSLNLATHSETQRKFSGDDGTAAKLSKESWSVKLFHGEQF